MKLQNEFEQVLKVSDDWPSMSVKEMAYNLILISDLMEEYWSQNITPPVELIVRIKHMSFEILSKTMELPNV